MKCFFFFPPHTTELQGWKTTSFFNRINHHMQFSFLNILLKNCTNIRTVQIIFNFKSYNGLSSYLEGTLSRSWYFARSPLLAFDWKHFPVNSAVFAIVPHVFIRAEIEDNILNFNTHSALITTFLFISINSYNSINILPPPPAQFQTKNCRYHLWSHKRCWVFQQWGDFNIKKPEDVPSSTAPSVSF